MAECVQLQWSHGALTVVTFFNGGNPGGEVVASMEPRCFNRGDEGVLRQDRFLSEASMEPRCFNRGDDEFRGYLKGNIMLQWSHGALTVVTGPWPMAWTGIAMLQWSHGALTVVTRSAR